METTHAGIVILPHFLIHQFLNEFGKSKGKGKENDQCWASQGVCLGSAPRWGRMRVSVQSAQQYPLCCWGTQPGLIPEMLMAPTAPQDITQHKTSEKVHVWLLLEQSIHLLPSCACPEVDASHSPALCLQLLHPPCFVCSLIKACMSALHCFNSSHQPDKAISISQLWLGIICWGSCERNALPCQGGSAGCTQEMLISHGLAAQPGENLYFFHLTPSVCIFLRVKLTFNPDWQTLSMGWTVTESLLATVI